MDKAKVGGDGCLLLRCSRRRHRRRRRRRLREGMENALLSTGGNLEVGEPRFGQPLARLDTLQDPNISGDHQHINTYAQYP